MDNTEVFNSIVNYLVENDYCKDEEGAYGIIENASDAMLIHLAEVAPALAAVPALAAKAGKVAAVAGKVGKAKEVADTAVGVGKAAAKAVSPHSGGDSAPVAKSESLEVVCDFLLDEGFADTATEAENIFNHMSEEWRLQILENRFAAMAGKDTDAGAAYAKSNKGGNKKGVYVMKGKDGKPLFDKK